MVFPVPWEAQEIKDQRNDEMERLSKEFNSHVMVNI